MRKWISLCFACGLLAAPFRSEGTLQVGNGKVRAEVEEGSGEVSAYRAGESAPFARFTLPGKVSKAGEGAEAVSDDRRIVLAAHPKMPFLLLTVAPAGKAGSIVNAVSLPELTLGDAYAPAEMRALGTAGLTAVDKQPGSYMYLAVARPVKRDGVVAAWVTSLRGSGIVFSGLSADKKHVAVRAETQYGRLVLPEGGEAGELFALGAFEDCRLGLEAYADLVAERFSIHLPPQPVGYCTWYADKFGGAGTEASTREFADFAAKELAPYGFSFFQIDDKWQAGSSKNGPDKNFTAHNPKGPYPSGMKATADYLKSKGVRPGLWFMPFAGNYDDPYFADKQDWFAKSAIDYPPAGQKNTRRYSSINQKKGAPYETFWGGTCLDMTDPAPRDYLNNEVARITRDWGYRYLKFDGLWTGMACEQLYVNDGYLPDDLGKQIFDDPRVTNVEAFRKGLEALRRAAGSDVFLLACNLSQNMRTMGAAYGLVDAMRIGPDNGPDWDAICRGPIRGTARYFFNGRVWYNDPDPVYVRDSIPLARAQLIASWAAISGALYAFSDWAPRLTAKRLGILKKTMAPCPGTRRPEDLFESPVAQVWHFAAGERHVIGLFNWNGKEPFAVTNALLPLGLDPAACYAAYDFWGDAFLPPVSGVLETIVPAQSCRMVSLVPLRGGRPALVSTSRHVLSPAFEVTDEKWDAAARILSGTSATVAGDRYELRLVLPEGLTAQAVECADGTDAKLAADGRNLRASWLPKAGGASDWKIRFK